MTDRNKFNTGYMVSTVDAKHTQHLYKYIETHQHSIRGYFKHIKIIMHKSLRWITLRMPVHRLNPIKYHILQNFPRHIPLRFKPIPYTNSSFEEIPCEQLHAYHKDPAVIKDIHDFITQFDYIEGEAMHHPTVH